MKKNYYKNYFLVLSCFTALFLSTITKAQNQNALSFDGVDDYAEAANASALIANSSQISMSFWFNPFHAPAGFPDFDGLCGFRNNVDADFYALHLNATDIEFRFRNSAGVNYDIVSTGVVLNTWQHYTMTYDGSMLRVYRNGLPHDSIAASGTIASATEAFDMGKLFYSGTDFYFEGLLDEVGLWNTTLTPSDINCIYHHSMAPGNFNLKLYYPLNQGTAGGTNTSVTTAIDTSAHINATLNNLALTGTTSNWVTGVTNFTAISANICPGSVYFFNGNNLGTGGVYKAYIPVTGQCDSVIELTLSVTDTSISTAGLAMHANQNGAVYQWRNCATGTAIAGATNQNYTPIVNGNYKCDITKGGTTCITSCYGYHLLGVEENSALNSVRVYPNPAESVVYIDFEKRIHNFTFVVNDLLGKELMKESHFNSQHQIIDISLLKPGYYFVSIFSEDAKMNFKLIKK